MATVAIGDIHGNLRALNHFLALLNGELTAADTVVFLGDIIDGFPDSKACVDRILQFKTESPAEIVALMGHHEEWFLQTARDPTKHSWILSMKGLSTIASYSKKADAAIRQEMQQTGPSLIVDHLPLDYDVFFRHVPETHIRFFESMVGYHRDGHCVFVHGGVSKDYAAVEQEDLHSTTWGHVGFPEDYGGTDTIVYGHFSDKAVVENSRPIPFQTERTICMDTVAHGVLTSIWMPEKRLVQSNKHIY